LDKHTKDGALVQVFLCKWRNIEGFDDCNHD
jgi:hypothetical protein